MNNAQFAAAFLLMCIPLAIAVFCLFALPSVIVAVILDIPRLAIIVSLIALAISAAIAPFAIEIHHSDEQAQLQRHRIPTPTNQQRPKLP